MTVPAHYHILFVMGVMAFAGVLGAWFFQRLRIPQVVGYIFIGVIIGESGIQLLDAGHIASLQPFNRFALGIIGLLVGGELRFATFRKYGRQFAAIMLGEGLLTFCLVGLSTGLLAYFVLDDVALALAAGVVFGAIASATDPASTVDVLWEYRAKGVLTSSLVAIVALDDALAMTLYGVGKSVATLLAGGEASFQGELLQVARELGGAILVGITLGLVVMYLLRRVREHNKALALFMGTVMLVIGIAVVFHLDVILATMTLGIVLANLSPRRSSDLFELLRGMSVPIYVLFFVLVGARLNIEHMTGWLWGLVVLYVIFRSLGKMCGAWIGARLSGAQPMVRRYVGLGLFSQGGVAVGLSMLASEGLQGVWITESLNLGDAIVFSITATTLLVQVLGPAMVKLAVQRSGEANRDLHEEDIIAGMQATDAMTSQLEPLLPGVSVNALLERFSSESEKLLPVVDRSGRLIGQVDFDAIQSVLPERETWDWLLAADVMRPVRATLEPSAGLGDALTQMNQTHREAMFIVESAENPRLLGVLKKAEAERIVRERLIELSSQLETVETD